MFIYVCVFIIVINHVVFFAFCQIVYFCICFYLFVKIS